MARLPLSASLGLLLLVSPARSQQTVTDLIPEDASFALVVRNLDDLRKKGEEFFDDNAVDPDKVGRPTEFFKKLTAFLGIEKGINEKGSIALVLPTFEVLGINVFDKELNTLFRIISGLTLVIPVDDLNDMAANFKLKANDLPKGKIVKVAGKGLFGGNGEYLVLLRGKHLYLNGILGPNEKALKSVVEGKPVTKALSAAQVKALAKADALLHFGPHMWGKAYRFFLDDLLKLLSLKGDKDNEVIEQFVTSLSQVRFIVGGLKLGKESRIDLVASLQKGEDGATALKFLKALSGGPGASDVIGLPKVDPMVLYAAKGDGERNVHMARALLKTLLDRWLGIKVFLDEDDRKKFLEAFEVMYKHLKGSRAVIYRTARDRAKMVGESAAVVILDLDDVEAHRKNWTRLVEVANNSAPVILREDRASTPKFAFKGKAEKIDGYEVDWLTVEVPGLKKEVRQEYERLLGPDWNKLRLAVQGKRVVGLFGSDVDALTETLANLKAGKKGLAENRVVASALKGVSLERKVEMHFNLANFVPFLREAKWTEPRPVKELTSLALTIEEDRIQMEVRASGSELKEIVRLLDLAKP